MIRPVGVILILLVVIAGLFPLFPPFPWSSYAASRGKAVHLFIIERSKNKNVVQYDVLLTEKSDLPDSDPVTAYWVMEKGRREELNLVEKKYAYGIASQEKIGKNKFRVHLVALKEREIIVQKIGSSFKAVISIQGKESILEKVFVESKEGLAGQPEVLFVDLFGRATRTNSPTKERITPGKG